MSVEADAGNMNVAANGANPAAIALAPDHRDDITVGEPDDARKLLRGFMGPDQPRDDFAQRCIRCGFCLPTCPTYVETYREASSPRGRIHLIQAVASGQLDVADPTFVDQMYECLDCRACEAVCPSGVQYGQLVETARTQIERATPRPWSQRLLRRVVFGGLFASMPRFRLFAGLLRLYQRTGLQRLARAPGLLRVAGLAERERMLPAIDRQFLVPKGQTWMPTGTAQRRVALFAGCVMSTAYAEIDRATARVLAANGCEVVAPPGQGCCGALHVHAGLLDDGRALMRRNVEAFERLDVEAIVVNAAGCGAALKEYGHLL